MLTDTIFSSRFLFLIFLVIVALPADFASAQRKKKKKVEDRPPGLVISEADHSTKYRIIIPASATENESKAAEVLQHYLLRISGAVLPIIEADKTRSPYEIVLGQNERLDDLKTAINFSDLQEDGFTIMTDSARLIIAGGSEKGTLYGVYTFLEKYLGCRMYSPKVRLIPRLTSISIPEINEVQVPAIAFRDTHYRVTWHDEYTEWHKLDHDAEGRRPAWGMWVHTFNTLVPPEIYYKEHPEYFAEVNGNRIPTQLCLSNPDVLEITIQNLRKRIAAAPDALYWSVSQNDNRNYCTCANCKTIDNREGSPSGSIISFVNKVADQFPDKMISTLAYEYGRQAPKNIKPRGNVNIMLCSIEVFRHLPIEDDSSSAEFMRDVQEWGEIASDIIVWDYVIQFNHLLSPFPNLHVLQPNIQFFVKHGVSAMFEQGNREVGGEFAALRAYLISKLLWDPNINVDTVMNDFLTGYYWKAAAPIREYIDEMRAALLASGKPLRIFGSPWEAETSYLTPALMKQYNTLFDQAEMAVADSAEVLERVRIARLPLQYATMEMAKRKYFGDGGVFQRLNGKWEARTDIRAMVDPFTDLCVRQGVTQVKEWSTSPEEYRSAMYRLLSQGMREHLAYGKKVTFTSPDTLGFTGNVNPARMLTDGIRGSHDYAYNWFAFPGQDLEVVVDLESTKQVRRIESAYYQYGFWLRLMPQKVEYFLSNDGENFVLVGSVDNTLPIDQYGGYQRDFIVEFEPRTARYVKVKAHSMGRTPEWHPGAGRPANMLVDEIVVE